MPELDKLTVDPQQARIETEESREAAGSAPSPRECPHCGSTAVIPVGYGLPTPGMLQAYAAGRLALGGVRETPGSPHWRCRGCDRTWGGEAMGLSSSP